MASFPMKPLLLFLSFTLALSRLNAQANFDPKQNTADILQLLQDSRSRSGKIPVLSPLDGMLGDDTHAALFDLATVQAAGFPVVAWTVNKSERLRTLLKRHVDGIISDRPDLLMEAVVEALTNSAKAHFDAQAHRGGRDLRPENTLPSFENGLDLLVNTLETDTGVTKDGVSLISHEEFINPQTCRATDGSSFTEKARIAISSITMAEAQRRFVCDKVFRGADQKNDLSLSPVAVAFAVKHGLASAYSPIYAGQLFEFVDFYVDYYRSGPGKVHADAEKRWRNAAKVRFNLETKLTPASTAAGETRQPQDFVDALCGAIKHAKLESRADVQSFDFRTLRLVEKEHPQIRTVYLMESVRWKKATP